MTNPFTFRQAIGENTGSCYRFGRIVPSSAVFFAMPKSDEQSKTSGPKRESAAPPPPHEVSGRGGYMLPQIVLPSRPLGFRFRLPIEVQNRVRAAMLKADEEYLTKDRDSSSRGFERERLAIDWICSVFGVFAEEACRLGDLSEPGWSPAEIEVKTEEFLLRLSQEAEATKGVSSLCASHGSLKATTLAAICESPEWKGYRLALRVLLTRCNVPKANPAKVMVSRAAPPPPMTSGIERAWRPANKTRPGIVEQAPLPTPTVKPRKPPGPHPDYESALQVQEIVQRWPKQEWRRHLEVVCAALDEAKIPPPEAWQRKNYSGESVGWLEKFEDDGGRSRHIVAHAIQHRLGMAQKHRELGRE